MPFPIRDGGRDERTAAAISVIGVGDKLKIQEMRIVWRTVSAKITYTHKYSSGFQMLEMRLETQPHQAN